MVIDDSRLVDLIGMPALRAVLSDARCVSSLHVSVLDAEGNLLLEGDAPGNVPLFCRLAQTTAEGATRCRRCALHAAFQAAGQQHAHVYHCHAGLTSLAVGLTAGTTFLGTLLVGPALCAPLGAPTRHDLRAEAAEIGVLEDGLLKAAAALPLVTEETLWACARMVAGAVIARAEASLQERASRAMGMRLEPLIRELCSPRPAPPAGGHPLPAAEQRIMDAWHDGDAAALSAAMRHLAGALALDWGHHQVLVRLRVLDLLTVLARHSDRGGLPGEVRDALIPHATALLGARTWHDVEGLLVDLGRELGRFLSLPAVRPSDPRIDHVVRYLRDNYRRDLSLQEIARSVGLSPQYFCALFKDQVGCSFVQYLRRVRLERARDLLRKTTLEVTEVAFESGFNDVTYFGQVFKATEGVTPSQYRRQGAWVRHLPPVPPVVPAATPLSRQTPVYEGP